MRKANIPREERELFDRVGEAGIQLMIAGGFTPTSQELRDIYANPAHVQRAQQWLTERTDTHARHEWRMERVEWAVLIFVVLGVVVDALLLIRGC